MYELDTRPNREPLAVEFRAERFEDDLTIGILRGRAIVLDALSVDLGGFRERIHASALERTFAESSDVRALIDHKPELVLGRTRPPAGHAPTLILTRERGALGAEIHMPRTPVAEALMVNIKRGDISGMSFAFRVPEGGDEWHREGPQVIREVRDLHLFDVSVVTFPAYPQTSVSVRSAYAAFNSRPAVPSRATLELEHRHRIIVASLDRRPPPAVGSLSSK